MEILPDPDEVDPTAVRAVASAALTRVTAARGVASGASGASDDGDETDDTTDDDDEASTHTTRQRAKRNARYATDNAPLSAYALYIHDALAAGGPNTNEQNFALARRGDINGLVTGNLLLVVAVAIRRLGAIDEQALLDVIQEGNRGLMRAAAQYDWRRNVPFASYAHWQINRFVLEEAARQRIPSGLLPLTNQLTLQRLHAARGRLEAERGRLYSLAEVAALLQAEELRAHGGDPEWTGRSVWPDADEIAEWLTTVDVDYLSQTIATTPTTSSGSPASTADDSGRITIADTVRAPDLRLPSPPPAKPAHLHNTPSAPTALRAPIAPRQAQADLRALRRARVLDDHQINALVLRFGLPHPHLRWRAPERWTLGFNHSIRWVADVENVGRGTIHRRLRAAFDALQTTTHARAQAMRTLALCAVPTPVVRRQRVTTLS